MRRSTPHRAASSRSRSSLKGIPSRSVIAKRDCAFPFQGWELEVIGLSDWRFSEREEALAQVSSVLPRPDFFEVRWGGGHQSTWEDVHTLGGYHDWPVSDFLIKHADVIGEQARALQAKYKQSPRADTVSKAAASQRKRHASSAAAEPAAASASSHQQAVAASAEEPSAKADTFAHHESVAAAAQASTLSERCATEVPAPSHHRTQQLMRGRSAFALPSSSRTLLTRAHSAPALGD